MKFEDIKCLNIGFLKFVHKNVNIMLPVVVVVFCVYLCTCTPEARYTPRQYNMTRRETVVLSPTNIVAGIRVLRIIIIQN